LKLWFFYTFASWKHNRKNIGHKKLPRTNLRKYLLEIIKLFIVHLWHLLFWRRRFLNIKLVFVVFHFLFGKYSEFRNHMNKFWRGPPNAYELPWPKVRMKFHSDLKKTIFGYQNFWLATKFLELVVSWRPEKNLKSTPDMIGLLSTKFVRIYISYKYAKNWLCSFWVE
jgi:hypothetical protein